MTINCSNHLCRAPLAPHLRDCVACGTEAGFPNVRAAESPDEVTALQLRYQNERSLAEKEDYLNQHEQFVLALGHSRAVIGMPISRLQPLIADPHALLSTYALQLEGQSRVPVDNRFDRQRSSVEGAFFPDYYKQIRFAALSLKDVGHVAYGRCSVAIKDSSIQARASVFESPLFAFAEKHKVTLGGDIPAGHRASWSQRARLAAIKFSRRISSAATIDEMQSLLLPQSDDTLSDCVEVHVFGSISLHSIEKITFFPETDEEDRLMQQSVILRAKRQGINVDVVE